MADKDFKVKTGLDLPAPLPLIEGGTGQTTANNALNAMLPSQTTHASKILGTDGTNTTWVNPGAAYQTSAPSNPVTGQLWVDSDETGDSLDPYIIRRKTITATAGQTVFTTDVVFTDGYEQIYYNGVLLVRTTDYTTSGGTNTVTLLQGASAGDTVEIISSTPINLVNTITSSGGTITAPNASAIPLKIVGASSQSADLFEVLNSSNAELFAVRSNGRIKSSIISTEIDSTILGLHANANNGSSGTSVILWGKDMATWGGDVHYLADSRGASGAHRFWNWDGTNFLQRMSIDKTGLVDMGVLKSTMFDPNYTLTDSTARTYAANTWYTLPGTLLRPPSSGSYFLQITIQYTENQWHSYAGACVLGIVQWKFGGTLPTITIPLDRHAEDSINVSIRPEIGNGTATISVNFSSAITVTSGGFVQIKAKRMF
jgi:hypothetical protein